jgi:hypothetical protein
MTGWAGPTLRPPLCLAVRPPPATSVPPSVSMSRIMRRQSDGAPIVAELGEHLPELHRRYPPVRVSVVEHREWLLHLALESGAAPALEKRSSADR